MEKYGLVGKKLGHSFSPVIHKYMGYEYGLFEMEEDKLGEFARNNDLLGYNVTIPYKEKIMELLDVVDGSARAVGAVNTVINRGGKKMGYNTDVGGMKYALARADISVCGKKVLILGSGGTAKTATAVMRDERASEVIIISRGGENNYDNLKKHSDAEIILNTTPVGMYPNVDNSPVDLTIFPRLCGVYDVIYNPLKTKLIMQAEKLGIPSSNGLSMLVAQAKYARDLFFEGDRLEDNIIEKILKEIIAEKRNIVLIGMPGSGKTSIGKMLAEKLGLAFVDTDAEIVRVEGKNIPDIFASFGEKYFRNTESEVIKSISITGGKVIATGGGAILRNENVEAMRLNGLIVYIERDVAKLASEGRPLSSSKDKIAEIFRTREPIYRSASDFSVKNNSDLESCISDILKIIS